jgi:murein DD-endopeptidase MepM/ murein hydrolase activator NlpD
MRKGHGRVAVAAVLFATLLVPVIVPAIGAVAADPEEQLEETRSKLDRWRERAEALEGEAGDLRATVKELSEQQIELRSIITDLDRQIAERERELAAVQARIDATQQKITRIEEAATEQAVALYKNGSTETMDALLSAQSLTELDSRANMLGQAAKENTGFLIRYARLKVEIEEQFREKYKVQQRLENISTERKAALKESEALEERHRATLVKVEKNLDEAHHHEDLLEKDAAKLIAKIQAAQSAAAPLPAAVVQSAGTSASGFIWPLPGAVTSYYGMRWGRLHAGIDIDGTSGQPIVASKAGRVIMAAPYSGYGNAVTLDHGGSVSTLYGHMSSFAVSSGQIVSQGQVIGYVGCTGSCTGDHLHFEVRVNGSPQDPMAYLP